MKNSRFKQGDHIFYRNVDGGHDPHTVWEMRYRGLTRGGWWIRLDDGRWVKSENCELQSEWVEHEA